MDVHKIAVLNGHFLPVREVRLDPAGTAVHSGWGVYTTVRIYRGRPFNVDAHVRRLERDAARVSVALPRAFRSVRADLADLVRRNGLAEGTGRISVLGGALSRFSGAGPGASDLLILTRDLRPRPPGEALWTAPYRFHTGHPLAATKTTSNLAYVQCRREAVQRQFDDAVILNESDHLVEVATGNLFWVHDEIVYTPSLETGCLDGSTRGLLLELARDQGIEVLQGAFPREHLLAAREAFISSVSREVAPVVRIDDHAFPNVPGPTAAALQEGCHAMLERWLEETTRPGPDEPGGKAAETKG